MCISLQHVSYPMGPRMHKSLNIDEAGNCQLTLPRSCRVSINGTSPPVDMTWCSTDDSTGSIEEFLSWIASQIRNSFMKKTPTICSTSTLKLTYPNPLSRNCIFSWILKNDVHIINKFIQILGVMGFHSDSFFETKKAHHQHHQLPGWVLPGDAWCLPPKVGGVGWGHGGLPHNQPGHRPRWNGSDFCWKGKFGSHKKIQ